MKILGKRVLIPVGILAALSLTAGAFVFQPWKLFIDTEVQESIPNVQPSENSSTESPESEILQGGNGDNKAAESAETEALGSVPADAEPVVLSKGSLISHEHTTSGTVKILQLADGSRILRLENLDTSDGPKVEVWLTDARVLEGQGGWAVFDDGKYKSLGAIKGNKGNQNYKIPDDLDLSEFSSVSLWCVTFSVSFGAAELT